MYKLMICLALVACVAAKPGIVAPLSYANTPLYAAGGSQQLDIRNNYDGTLSSYTTAPFSYAPPYSSRYVSGIPPAVASPAAFAAPASIAAPARYSAPLPFAAPFAAPAAYAEALAAANYASAAAAPFATHFGGSFAAPPHFAPAPAAYSSPAFF